MDRLPERGRRRGVEVASYLDVSMHDVACLQGGQGLEELVEENLDVGGGEGLGGDQEAGEVRVLELQHQEELLEG